MIILPGDLAGHSGAQWQRNNPWRSINYFFRPRAKNEEKSPTLGDLKIIPARFIRAIKRPLDEAREIIGRSTNYAIEWQYCYRDEDGQLLKTVHDESFTVDEDHRGKLERHESIEGGLTVEAESWARIPPYWVARIFSHMRHEPMNVATVGKLRGVPIGSLRLDDLAEVLDHQERTGKAIKDGREGITGGN